MLYSLQRVEELLDKGKVTEKEGFIQLYTECKRKKKGENMEKRIEPPQHWTRYKCNIQNLEEEKR